MRRFLVQAAIDGLIAVAVMFVLSLIDITQPFPFGQDSAPIIQPVGDSILVYLVWGAIFALVNRVVRPALIAVFGRWIFSTLGLFVVVITALTIAGHVTAVPGPDRHPGRPAAASGSSSSPRSSPSARSSPTSCSG